MVIKITKPDPEGQPNRRKLWVDKTAAVKPPPLGITMGDAGNDYDSTPPTEPESAKAGRPPEKRDKVADSSGPPWPPRTTGSGKSWRPSGSRAAGMAGRSGERWKRWRELGI